ncbi:MAG: tripartite tricarboxylate transporter substrate binding protein BugE [Rubrivivax sp.]|nr:tripartite tricarboxylate transporter substrate binding protein BugE [Rubrivivax sp.]
MNRRETLILLNAAGAAALCAAPALLHAQTRTLRLVVPFPAGGATDITARTLAEPLGRELGMTVVVDNRAGAGGSIGMTEVARAAGDGLTLGLATLSTHGVNPAVYRKLPYDAVKDFAPVTQLVKAPGVLVVSASLQVNSFADFVKLLKAKPGQLSYASAGNGTISHMWAELFKSSTGTFMVHIPYRGAAPAMTDVMSGQVAAYFDQVASSLPHIKSGRLRPLAVSWPTRLPMLPDVPTFAEMGLLNNNAPSWFGLVAPVSTPAALVRKIQTAVVAVLRDAQVTERLLAQGLFPSPTEPQEFGALIQREIERFAEVSKFAKITLD